jgi:hypothetical protein
MPELPELTNGELYAWCMGLAALIAMSWIGYWATHDEPPEPPRVKPKTVTDHLADHTLGLVLFTAILAIGKLLVRQ